MKPIKHKTKYYLSNRNKIHIKECPGYHSNMREIVNPSLLKYVFFSHCPLCCKETIEEMKKKQASILTGNGIHTAVCEVLGEVKEKKDYYIIELPDGTQLGLAFLYKRLIDRFKKEVVGKQVKLIGYPKMKDGILKAIQIVAWEFDELQHEKFYFVGCWDKLLKVQRDVKSLNIRGVKKIPTFKFSFKKQDKRIILKPRHCYEVWGIREGNTLTMARVKLLACPIDHKPKKTKVKSKVKVSYPKPKKYKKTFTVTKNEVIVN